MALALFDLDHTLLSGDSDHSWGQFLAEHAIVDPDIYAERSDFYFAEYQAGRLDIQEFLDFQLAPLAGETYEAVAPMRDEYIGERVRPLITQTAAEMVAYHRARGDTLAIVTATNDFITRPIADLFEIEHLIATELEVVEGVFTGKIVGEPCFREGKVVKLRDWMATSGDDLRGSWFYTDSHNDLPLLERVEHPVAVNPDLILEREATRRDWPIRRF